MMTLSLSKGYLSASGVRFYCHDWGRGRGAEGHWHLVGWVQGGARVAEVEESCHRKRKNNNNYVTFESKVKTPFAGRKRPDVDRIALEKDPLGKGVEWVRIGWQEAESKGAAGRGNAAFLQVCLWKIKWTEWRQRKQCYNIAVKEVNSKDCQKENLGDLKSFSNNRYKARARKK